MAIEYGTIAVVPKGEWDSNTQYEVANLVTLDGSSYIAHTEPPVGTLPTNTAYWQVSAQGTSKATADSVGTVKPDGVTTEVSADGTLSAKTATQSTAGMVKGSQGITVGTGGAIDVNTAFTQATELANIIAGEAIAQVLGKISKSIATTMNLDQNALLKNMLTNMDANDSSKIPTSAFIHTLVERIGMGEDLDIGDNLTAAFNALNSNLGNKGAYSGDLNDIPFVNNILTVYRADSACANIPTTGYAGIVETLYIDSASNAIQRFVSLDSVQSSWIRRKFNGTWGNWTKNLTSGGAYDGDLNNIPFITANVPTFYRAAATCTNIPSADYPGVVETLYVDSSAYAIQRFTSMDATSSFWVRRKYNGTWGAWVSK